MPISPTFSLSIVSPVFNVAPYLRDFLRSVERQDIGFRRNVQLVLVDDGSTDGSGAICDAFARRHPGNVAVLHQSNAGQAAARKAGLALATGRVVNFCDPDDILSRNACRKALAMLDAHPDVDVAALPIFFFDGRRGGHPLNDKFRDGSRIADLSSEWNVVTMALNASFVRRTALGAFDADPRLVVAEDAKELLRVLLANPKLALVAGAKYRYRVRLDSTMSTKTVRPEAYLPVLEHFEEWAVGESIRLHGRILPFVQHTVLYDLSWKFGRLPPSAMGRDERASYHGKVLRLLGRLDDKAFLSSGRLNPFRKLLFLARKRGSPPVLAADPATGEPRPVLADGLRFDEPFVKCTVFKLDPEPGGFRIRALLESPAFDGFPEPELVARRDGGETVFVRTGSRPDEECCGRPLLRTRCVAALVPFGRGKRSEVSFYARFPGFPDVLLDVGYRDFAPLTRRVPHSFFRCGKRILRPTKCGFRVEPASFLRHAVSELAFDWALLRRPAWGEKAAVCFRWAYYFLKPFAPRRVWLVTDRMSRADDNGFALFQYLMAHRKELGIRPKFVLHPKSPDRGKVRAVGPVVPFTPIRYRLASLLSDWTVSSHFDDFVRKPFLDRQYPYNDLFHGHRFAFLQHGITQNDLSDAFNRARKDFSVFVAASPRERDAILARDAYDYTGEEVVLAGFPRFDRLRDEREKAVTFLPTWRMSLFGPIDLATDVRPLRPGFENSAWYRSLEAVLASAPFLDEAERLGYRVRFLPHPTFAPHLRRFRFDPRVEMLGPGTDYRDVFATSALCVTDYSSAVFDFAYLGKPVVYCQTDEIHWTRGYFDYGRDGFGPVGRDAESLVRVLVDAMRKGCPLEEPYRSRVEAFFPFRDRDNCRRVADAILAADARLRSRG